MFSASLALWQNGFAERLIGSIRRECVDHIVVLNEAHLRRILQAYAGYLQRRPNASVIEQRCAGLSPGSADWKYQLARNPRRTSSPLRADLGLRYTDSQGLGGLEIDRQLELVIS
jgi:hypothetical protein